MDNIIKYLTTNEWTRGNGQCDTCGGLKPTWHRFGEHSFFQGFIGHENNCLLAAALEEAGIAPRYKREGKYK